MRSAGFGAALHRPRRCDEATMNEPALSLSVVVTREVPADTVAVERLAERAFGPGRFARTAYRLREAADPDWDLCYVARVSTLLVGSNRMTPVEAGAAAAFMLGPITVDPAFRGRGIAAALMGQSLDAARAAGHRLVVLVGDEPYYRRFGFTRVPAGRLALPGPGRPRPLSLVRARSGGVRGRIGRRCRPPARLSARSRSEQSHDPAVSSVQNEEAGRSRSPRHCRASRPSLQEM